MMGPSTAELAGVFGSKCNSGHCGPTSSALCQSRERIGWMCQYGCPPPNFGWSSVRINEEIKGALLRPPWLWVKSSAMTIGVLALQGDFDAHRRRLEELGADRSEE